MLLLFVATCGFILNKNQIPGGWNGVYWRCAVRPVAVLPCAALRCAVL